MSSIRSSAAKLIAGVLFAACATSVAAQEKVTFNMSWLPQGSVIGPIVALDQGYFKEAGLDVTLVRGYGGNRTANELDQGQFEIGYVDAVSLMLNRSNGGKIRLVGAINTSWPGGICYVDKTGTPRPTSGGSGASGIASPSSWCARPGCRSCKPPAISPASFTRSKLVPGRIACLEKMQGGCSLIRASPLHRWCGALP